MGNQELKAQYTVFIQEYIDLGHMTEVNPKEIPPGSQAIATRTHNSTGKRWISFEEMIFKQGISTRQRNTTTIKAL